MNLSNVRFHPLGLNWFSPFFLASDVGLAALAGLMFDHSPRVAIAAAFVGLLDAPYHMSGEKDLAITQHIVTPPAVGASVYAVKTIYKHNKTWGAVAGVIFAITLACATANGGPGDPRTPNYDVFTQPNLNDPNFLVFHTVLHTSLTVLLGAYHYVATQGVRGGKTATKQA